MRVLVYSLCYLKHKIKQIAKEPKQQTALKSFRSERDPVSEFYETIHEFEKLGDQRCEREIFDSPESGRADAPDSTKCGESRLAKAL